MRLLPVRHDHGGQCAAGDQAHSHRRRDRRLDHQHLPLRNLSAHPQGDPSTGRGETRRLQAVRSHRGRQAMKKWTRRTFIGVGSVLGGGFVIGVGEFVFAPNRLSVAPPADTGVRLTTWIKLAADNTVTAVVPHCEMGQGSQTGLAMMLAEELEADWNLVRVEEAAGVDEFAAGYLVRGFGLGGGSPPPPMLRGLNHLTYKVA